jgi:hypothetical protein
MLKNLLKDIYARLPGVRDLLEVRDGISEIRDLNRETRMILSQVELGIRQLRETAYTVGAGSTLRLLDLELERHPRYGDPKRLLRNAFQVCSQNGEDGMIHDIFRRIGTPARVFAEVGIGDGRENNTAFLLSQGWSGYWIDGNDQFVKGLESRVDLQDGCIRSKVAFVSKENIAKLFEELGVPREFDLLSLDIDQNTFYVWEGLRDFRPRVVVVEYNASLPPDVDWKVRYDPSRGWDGSNNFGASLKAYEKLGRELEYSLVGCDFIGVNAFFVRSDLVADLFCAPFTAENHYEPPRYALWNRRGHPPAILDRRDGTR